MTGQNPNLNDERAVLLHYVQGARKAIEEIRPAEMRSQRLPSAMNEIGMIVETTESAANQIMEAIDVIMNAPAELPVDEYRSLVEAKCMSMLEACAFQDLTGQRSTKVVETLLHIEDRLGRLASLLGEEERSLAGSYQSPEAAPDPLLNGPAMPGEGVDQDDIDRLFADA